jgi:hypothetical protein
LTALLLTTSLVRAQEPEPQAAGEDALGIVALGEAAKVARIEPDVRSWSPARSRR